MSAQRGDRGGESRHRLRLAVVGGGWAGLSAAAHALGRGHDVTLFDAAAQVGGRARSFHDRGLSLDNGQHILIGAYSATLALMRRVGVHPGPLLMRLPLAITYPDGHGLRLPAGAPIVAFLRGVLSLRDWPLMARVALSARATRWMLSGFRCAADATVADLTRSLPACVHADLIEPLCVAALNTPASRASGRVFLRVLKDALFSGAGSADLLLPRAPLQALLPEPAARWLAGHGATLLLRRRVAVLDEAEGMNRSLDAGRTKGGWRVDGDHFDAVVLACPATEAARLTQAIAPGWSSMAAAFEYEPIITVYMQCDGARLARPMTALHAHDTAPAQFVFDHGWLSGRAGLFAWVVSGARAWVDRGLDACAAAVLAQASAAFPAATWPTPPRIVRTLAEKRATFLCTPNLQRPPTHIAARLAAAGDYTDGPYPATLEGAVRSGIAAVDAVEAGPAKA